MKLLKCIIICSIFFSCNSNEKKISNNSIEKSKRIDKHESLSNIQVENNDIIELNSRAVKLTRKSQSKFISKNEKDSVLNLALNILNEVIKKDSCFYEAFTNKATVLRNMGRLKESMKVLKDLIDRKEFADGLFALGLSYDRIGNEERASMYYQRALKAYKLKLNSPYRTAVDEVNFVYALLFVEKGKVPDKSKFEQYNINYQFAKDIIDHFNKEEFILNF